MPNIIDEQDKELIYRMMLDGHKPHAIEQALGSKIKRRAIAWHIDKIKRTLEYQIVKEGAHEAVQTYALTRDAIQKQIAELTDKKYECEAAMKAADTELKEVEKLEHEAADDKERKLIKARKKEVLGKKFGAQGLWLGLQGMIKERWLDIFKIQADGSSVLALRKKMMEDANRVSEGITQST